ncbi:hypothetical protein CERSUDRAFT_117053 [Gelatoporia subvermispora B]|uniref:Uncharacterized protein n=1 Tax=Ceriporiopsis subvermispora (strain B) TaxID=914234 RepID=M2R8T9_CERS8|nr:hypothetical protein CERSUDRAFT_117053 [Gelatoporia subvermispora B]
MHVEKTIGSAILSVFNDAPDALAVGLPTSSPWRCIANTDIQFPVGLKGSHLGGCRPDLAIQAIRHAQVQVVKDAVVFVAEAKKDTISYERGVAQMAFAIHCTLLMLLTEHYSRQGWEIGPLNEDQAKVLLPDNFFILSIYYWGRGMRILANYPTLVQVSRGVYQWRLCCSLLRQYEQPHDQSTLTYQHKFTLYRAILSVEQHVTNLKHLFCETDYRSVVEPTFDTIQGHQVAGDYNRGKANIRLFLDLHGRDRQK